MNTSHHWHQFLPYILSHIDYPLQLTVDALKTRSSFTLSIPLPYSRPLHNHKPLPCYELRCLHSLNKWISRPLPFQRFTHVSNKPFNEIYFKLFYFHMGNCFTEFKKNINNNKLFYCHPINWFFRYCTKYLLLLRETIFMLLERKWLEYLFFKTKRWTPSKTFEKNNAILTKSSIASLVLNYT